MPYKSKEDHNEQSKLSMRAYRQRKSDDPIYKMKESERKAKWYEANKEKKAEAQRRYREKLRAQKIQDELRQIKTQ